MIIRKTNLTKIITRQYSRNVLSNHLSSKNIRQQFLDYFIKENGHKFIRSSPVVPFCDPTVSFVNAGMNQFKNVFLGNSVASCNKAANSQKCIRVGGKHNDLSVVGTDSYHHTFFEMLGNWSFGDYFKEDACKLAWNLLKGPYQIDTNRLYVTYFKGDEVLNLPPDLECREIWRQIGVPDERIVPFGCADNFWEMGSSGPCGPCTEIHIDHLPDYKKHDRSKFVNAGRSDLTELWNLVFIQYNRNLDGSITHLPQTHIDTGMGMERLVALLQGKTSNYDTDLFQPIFKRIQKSCSEIDEYNGCFDVKGSTYSLDTSYRILADHSRMITACLADGMFPDQNHKLRRILRKSILLSERSFQHKKLLHEIVPVVTEILGETYPEMTKKLPQILQIISHEEEVFKALRLSTNSEVNEILTDYPKIEELDAINIPGFVPGFKEFQKFKSSLGNQAKVLPGDLMFKLYDTYGFDEETLVKLAELEGFDMDRKGFEEQFNKTRQRTKQNFQVNNGICSKTEMVRELMKKSVKLTENDYKYSHFYDKSKELYSLPVLRTKISAIFVNNELVDKITSETQGICHLVTEKSNFYYESGGQESDLGKIVNPNFAFEIRSVDFLDGYIFHIGTIERVNDVIRIGDEIEMEVDSEQRSGNILNHTGTHLLNAAVRQITESAVCQKSSCVTHSGFKLELGIFGKKLNRSSINDIETLIRKLVSLSVPVQNRLINSQELLQLENVILVPGEVYPETGLRVLDIEHKYLNFLSRELCCGTHATNTKELLDFCITNVKQAGRGSYVINGITGMEARQAHLTGAQMLENVLTIKSDTESGKQKIQDLESRTQRLKNMLMHGFENNVVIPHSIKLECLEILNEIYKQIKDSSKESLREFVEIEMKNVLEMLPPDKEFIVHYLACSVLMELVPLQKATRCCTDRPILVIGLENGLVKARCCVPKNKINKNFNAEKWMKEISKIFKAQSSAPKGQNPEEVCNMKARKIVPSVFEAQLEAALQNAKQFVEEHL